MAKRSNGEGTAIKFNERLGRYEQRIGYRLDGKNKIKAFYGKTVKEIKEKVKAWEKSKDYGLDLQADKMTYSEWGTRWFETYKKHSIEFTTYAGYESVYNNHICPEIGQMKLKDIKRPALQGILNHAYKKGLANGTIKNIKRVLVSSFRQAKLDGLIIVNPAEGLKVPKSDLADEEKDVAPFTKEELNLLLATAKNEDFQKSAPYMHNIIYLLLYTGIRIGELLGLEWSHIDFNRQLVYIRQNKKKLYTGVNDMIGKLKTKSARRDIPIDNTVVMILKQQKSLCNQNKLILGEDYYKDKSFVFADISGMPLKHHTVKYYWAKLLKTVSIEHRGIHQLRHTFASIAIQKGVNIKQLSSTLGHSKVNITYDVYGHLYPEDTSKVTNAISEFMSS